MSHVYLMTLLLPLCSYFALGRWFLITYLGKWTPLLGANLSTWDLFFKFIIQIPWHPGVLTTLYQALGIPRPSFPLPSIPLCGLGEVNSQRGLWSGNGSSSWDREGLLHFAWIQPCHEPLKLYPWPWTLTLSTSLPSLSKCFVNNMPEKTSSSCMHTFYQDFVPLHMRVFRVYSAPRSVGSEAVGLQVRYGWTRLNIILMRKGFS